MALQDFNTIWDTDENGKPTFLTYNGEIDSDILDILKESGGENNWYMEVAETLSLDPKYVELILHYLAHLDLVDYGTSPRGAWISEKGRKYLNLRSKDD